MKKLILLIISTGYIYSHALASDQFLVVGGGYAPYHSEATLEKNVLTFSDVMNSFHLQNSEATYLFGSGMETQNLDVIEQIPNFPLEDNLFAGFFDGCEAPDCHLRHNQLGNLLNNSATKRNILDSMDMMKGMLSPADKFRFYFTGHGSHENDPDFTPNFTKNYFLIWNREHISVQEFTEKLDQLPSETQTQVVMVQCYSGGFAQINYAGGNKNNALTPANRCGFFAQVPDRIAAGCTPDLQKREEYSRYFWEAYRGATEEGQAIEADFNQDSKVTSDEAHAYVIIHENSIDVPITTSTQLLRDQEFSLPITLKRKTWNELKNTLTPIEQVIIKGLEEKTGYEMPSAEVPLVFVEEQIARIQKMKELSSQKRKAVQNLFDEVFVQIRNHLSMTHPVFNNPYGANHGASFVPQPSMIQAARNAMLDHPEYARFKDLFLKRNEAREENAQWERLKTLWERLHYLLETKLLEEHLNASPLDVVKQKYQSLKDCESASFF